MIGWDGMVWPSQKMASGGVLRLSSPRTVGQPYTSISSGGGVASLEAYAVPCVRAGARLLLQEASAMMRPLLTRLWPTGHSCVVAGRSFPFG